MALAATRAGAQPCPPVSLDLSLLDGTNGFLIPGIDPGDVLGQALDGAGDADADGIPDLLVGAPAVDDDLAPGKAYVIFGRAAGYPAVLDPASLDGATGFTLPGVSPEHLGISPAGSGDVSGDGIDDFMLGTSRPWAPFMQAGYGVFGAPGPWPPVFDVYTGYGFKFVSGYMNTLVGNRVAGAGDVNGDGLGDVLISDDFRYVTCVVFGTRGAFPPHAFALDGQNGFGIWARGPFSGAGDLNGDGFDDVVIGEPTFAGSRGRAVVVFGAASGFPGWPGSFDVSTLDGTNGFILEGTAPGDQVGSSVSEAGDVNGDGRGDLLVGAASYGRPGHVYVLYGAPAFTTPISVGSIDGTNGVVLEDSLAERAGASVAAAGDANGDGFGDVVIGAPLANIRRGRAYVVLGGPSLPSPIALSSIAGAGGFVLQGIDPGDEAGSSVAGAGDLDGNGLDDVLVGAPHAASWGNSLIDAGEAYAVFSPGIVVRPLSLPDGVEGLDYDVTFTASGGVPPYTWSATGALPPGLALDPAAGRLAGTPTAQGSYAFDVAAVDSRGCTLRGRAARRYTVRIRPAVDAIVGPGFGQGNPNRIRVFDRQGGGPRVDVQAYAAGTMGTNVASGSIDAAPYASLVSGPGPGPTLGPHVRAFQRSGAAIAKVSFYAYGTLRYGAGVDGARLDADAFHEILTGAGAGAAFGPHVRGFDYDGVALAALPKVSFFAYGTLAWGVEARGADVDADGFAEILSAPGPGPAFGCQVRGFAYDAAAVAPIAKINFLAFPTLSGGQVAGGDVDADGFDEIAVAPGAGPANPQRCVGFQYDGVSVTPAPGFDVTPTAFTYGGRLSLADLAGVGAADLIAAPGPDPAAPSEVRTYGYAASALVPGVGFPAYPLPFGAQPAGGPLGYF